MPLTLEILRALTQSRIMKRFSTTTTTNQNLPSLLQDNVPTCAQQCVANSIDQYFNSTMCSNSTDLGCLCSHYSAQGLTLGETSLICLNADCSQLNASASSAAYSVCAGQSTAVVPTHSVLTSFETATDVSVTVSQTVSASASTASGAESSSDVSSTSKSTASKTAVASVSAASLTFLTSSRSTAGTTSLATSAGLPSITTTTTPSSSATETPTTTPRAGISSTLTSGQAVGLSLGAFGGMGMLVALIFCCICVRRKKKEKEKQTKKKDRRSFDFVDKSPAGRSSFPASVFVLRGHHAYPDIRQQDQQQQHTERVAERTEADIRSHNHNTTAPTLGASISIEPSTAQDRMTRWPVPKFGAVPAKKPAHAAIDSETRPPRPPRPPRPDSNVTTLTMFEEDNRSPQFKRHTMPSLPCSPTTRIPPPPAPQKERPSLGPRFAEHYTLSPETTAQPNLSLRIPATPIDDHNTLSQRQQQSPYFFPSISPHSTTTQKRRSNRLSTHPPNSAISYLPSYYTSADSRTPVAPANHRFSYDFASSSASQIPVPTVPYRHCNPFSSPIPASVYPNANADANAAKHPDTIGAATAATAAGTRQPHLSYASSTTDFESLDPDEVTPPTEDEGNNNEKRLSAVAESPIAGVRYPKVPRPSNQAVPRSPAFVNNQSRRTASTGSPVSPEQQQQQRQKQMGGFKAMDKQGAQVSSTDDGSRGQITLLTKRRGEDARLCLVGKDNNSLAPAVDRGWERKSSVYSCSSASILGYGSGCGQTGKEDKENQGWRVGEGGSPLRGKGVGRGIGNKTGSTGGDGGRAGKQSAQGRSPELVIKSPLWEPELTPSKRGDDLFISVQ